MYISYWCFLVDFFISIYWHGKDKTEKIYLPGYIPKDRFEPKPLLFPSITFYRAKLTSVPNGATEAINQQQMVGFTSTSWHFRLLSTTYFSFVSLAYSSSAGRSRRGVGCWYSFVVPMNTSSSSSLNTSNTLKTVSSDVTI